MSKDGMLIIISGPSGVGKDSVFKEMNKNYNNFYLSVSVTTRCPRFNEKDGIDYFFVDSIQFENLVNENKFLEHVVYSGNRYGTLYSEVESNIKKGKDVVLIVETSGGLEIKKKIDILNENINYVLIYILPPSLLELENRLLNRNTESLNIIQKRLENAGKEIKESEFYDYHIINNSITECAFNILKIIKNRKNNEDVLKN